MDLNWQVFENRKAESWMKCQVKFKKSEFGEEGYFLGSTGVVCECMLLWEVEGNQNYIK